jgi:hypothetical protein
MRKRIVVLLAIPRPGALTHILVHYAKKLRSRLRERR